jgi:hypothetical protein
MEKILFSRLFKFLLTILRSSVKSKKFFFYSETILGLYDILAILSNSVVRTELFKTKQKTIVLLYDVGVAHVYAPVLATNLVIMPYRALIFLNHLEVTAA